jgi:hypothetical protein
VHVQQVNHGKRHQPEPYNRCADGEDNPPGTPVFRVCGFATPYAETLSEKTDNKDRAAEN